MTSQSYINVVVKDFYTRAISDPIIGFHFRKIQEFEGADPMRPPIEAFANHLPRINKFWAMQLLGDKAPLEKPFNLLKTHEYLLLKRGQVDRWLTLFYQALEDSNGDQNFIDLWKQKLVHFRSKFP